MRFSFFCIFLLSWRTNPCTPFCCVLVAALVGEPSILSSSEVNFFFFFLHPSLVNLFHLSLSSFHFGSQSHFLFGNFYFFSFTRGVASFFFLATSGRTSSPFLSEPPFFFYFCAVLQTAFFYHSISVASMDRARQQSIFRNYSLVVCTRTRGHEKKKSDTTTLVAWISLRVCGRLALLVEDTCHSRQFLPLFKTIDSFSLRVLRYYYRFVLSFVSSRPSIRQNRKTRASSRATDLLTTARGFGRAGK